MGILKWGIVLLGVDVASNILDHIAPTPVLDVVDDLATINDTHRVVSVLHAI